ncbi:YafY family transcriptional regulator [Paenibacillus nanensis]|uniref:YafY family transcriptional regulator n=1 Tax=Paenibacillus nanensis TaxID=393251 RepID=A0A3A1ULU2_9BACL|nr:YafY family protein [Paenibacillus nanensis]RIX48723.1 YafY family transcriptional regulator [Paenibacillus nanensis]
MKLDRLLAITMELLTKKRVRASELAARFEVSTRTIYREIELINQAGFPVVSFTGADGGFELMDGFFLTKQQFTVQDFSIIYKLIQGIESAVSGKYTTLKHRIGSLHPKMSEEDTDDILLDLSTAPEEKEPVRMLSAAIHARKAVSFNYRSSTNDVTERSVEPAKLYWERGAWYVEGYCLSRRANRWFRISRITRLQLLEEHFLPREPVPDSPANPPLGIAAHLRFEPAAEPRVSEQFREECRHCGDHIEVKTVFYKLEYAVSIILSYGSKVVVVSPPELKEAVSAELKATQSRYDS